MTRKSRNLVVALGVVVLLLAILVFSRVLSNRDQELSEEIPERPRDLISTPVVDVRVMRVENEEGGFELTSADGQSWLVSGTSRFYRENTTEVRSVVANLSSVTAQETIAEKPEDFSAFGLEPIQALVSIQDKDGGWQRLEIGYPSPSGAGRYARVPGEDTVYLIAEWRAAKAFVTPENLRDRSLPTPDIVSLTTLEIETAENSILAEPRIPRPIEDEYITFGWLMDLVRPWLGRYPVEAYRLQQALENTPLPVSVLRYLDDADPADPRFGLGENADRLVLEDAEGIRLALRLGTLDEEGYRYVLWENQDGPVFLLNQEDLGILDLDPFHITGRWLFLGSISRVGSIRVQSPEKTYVMLREERGDAEDEQDDFYSINNLRVPVGDFTRTFQSIIGLRWEGVAREQGSVGFPEIRITFGHIDENIPSQTLSFWDYDANYYIASLEGYPREFLIGRYAVDDMLEAVDVLLEGTS